MAGEGDGTPHLVETHVTTDGSETVGRAVNVCVTVLVGPGSGSVVENTGRETGMPPGVVREKDDNVVLTLYGTD